MKKLLTIVVLTPYFLFAQIDYKKEAKADLKKIDSLFKDSKNKLKTAQDSLQDLTSKLSPDLISYYDEVKAVKKKTDSIYNIAKISIDFYSQKKVNKKTLDSLFQLTGYTPGVNKKENIPEKTYILFGDDKLISKEKIVKDSLANVVLNSIFKDKSETHFGDFWFPMDGQQIPVVPYCKIRKDSICDESQVIRNLKFEKIDIDIYEGSIRDIKVYLKNSEGNTYLFENSRSISLLRFNNLSGRNYLKNSSLQTYENKDFDYENYYLRVSDILRYFSRPDGNFIPSDESFSFPISNENGKTNAKASNRYELRQATSLNNVLDLRAYTDFLGLAGQEANGIAQFEGQADFFVLPYGFPTKKANLFLFKKIKPYISFSRLDEENKFINIKNTDTVSSQRTLRNRLEHLQKSYLDLGVKLDLYSLTFSKDSPFEVVLYGATRYQIAKVKTDSINSFNYKTLGLGGGINVEFRRLKNFKFNYSSEFMRYNHNSYNDIEGITNPEQFWVFRNEAEISYYPSKSKSNAIFTRLRVFHDQDANVGSNFFQFQFGYKFTIGVSKLKTGD